MAPRPGATPTSHFDAVFYTTYYQDLLGLPLRDAARHYALHGAAEGRAANAAEALARLEEQEGPIPVDFDPETYRALNPDIRNGVKGHAAAARHYLQVGRGEGRKYRLSDLRTADSRARRAEDAEAQPLVYRSIIEDLRAELTSLFGPAAENYDFVQSVYAGCHAAKRSGTVAAPLMTPAIVGCFVLGRPNSAQDLSRFSAQLNALFFAWAGKRRACHNQLESAEVTRTLAEAQGTVIAAAEGGLPPLTLFVLAARVSLLGNHIDAEVADPHATVSEFYGRDIHDFGLHRFLTQAEFRALAEKGRSGEAIGLELAHRYARHPSPSNRPSERDRTDFDLWSLGAGYFVRSTAQHLECSITTDGGPRLTAPDFLRPLLAGIELNGRENISATEFSSLQTRVREAGLPDTIIGPSVLANLHGRPRAQDNRASAQPTGRRSLLGIEVGQIVEFGRNGSGSPYLKGTGWYEPEQHIVWGSGIDCLVIFRCFARPGSSLDLHLDLAVYDPQGDQEVVIHWNGELLSRSRVDADARGWRRVPTGDRIRQAPASNVLALGATRLHRPSSFGSHDNRILGVGIRGLMVAAR